jgi:hypothetical protein
METKKLIWFGAFVGSTIGAYLPNLWGAGMFSFSSVILSALGGILGIYFCFKISQF